MKKLLLFLPSLFFACNGSDNAVKPEENILSEDYIAFEHEYHSNKTNGKSDEPIDYIKFKVLNEDGIELLNLNQADLANHEYFAIMEIKTNNPSDKSITLSNGLTLHNDGVKFDRSTDDGVYTSLVPIGYTPNKNLAGRTTGGSFSVGCDFEVILAGNSCDDGYKCNAWAGYCYCITNCSFKLKIEW